MGRREQHIGMSVADFTSDMESCTYAELANGTLNMQSVTSTGLNIQSDTLGTRNQNNVIVVERTPIQRCSTNDSKFKLCLANVRSIKPKSAALLNYITSREADLFAITETWLTPLDVAAKLQIVPPGYRFVHRPRTDRTAGGIGLLYRDAIAVKKFDVSPKILANEFGKFFEQKIENIHQTLDVLSVRPSDSDPNDVVLAAHAPLTRPSAPVIKSATVMPHLTSFSS